LECPSFPMATGFAGSNRASRIIVCSLAGAAKLPAVF
jgi:hypothetical protein